MACSLSSQGHPKERTPTAARLNVPGTAHRMIVRVVLEGQDYPYPGEHSGQGAISPSGISKTVGPADK